MDKGFTVWLTGLPCSGKTTIAELLEEELSERELIVDILDGNSARQKFSPKLGFSKKDRDAHVKRIADECKKLCDNGLTVICALISPYREARDDARKKIGDFVEVYVKCPVSVCMERDVRGLYKKAQAGEIKDFTGVSAPYEEPENAEVIVETDIETPEESVQKIIITLEALEYVPKVEAAYSEEEEEKVKKRLAALGYL